MYASSLHSVLIIPRSCFPHIHFFKPLAEWFQPEFPSLTPHILFTGPFDIIFNEGGGCIVIHPTLCSYNGNCIALIYCYCCMPA